MRNTLPHYPYSVGCGIVKLNITCKSGSHWLCYYRNKSDFDSYGQITPLEIQWYLKTGVANSIMAVKLYRGIQILYKLQIHQCVSILTEIINERSTVSNNSKSHTVGGYT